MYEINLKKVNHCFIKHFNLHEAFRNNIIYNIGIMTRLKEMKPQNKQKNRRSQVDQCTVKTPKFARYTLKENFRD